MNIAVLAAIEYGMEMAQLELEKQLCKEMEKNILMVIDEGIFADHERILREAVANYIDDFPIHRYYFFTFIWY